MNKQLTFLIISFLLIPQCRSAEQQEKRPCTTTGLPSCIEEKLDASLIEPATDIYNTLHSQQESPHLLTLALNSLTKDNTVPATQQAAAALLKFCTTRLASFPPFLSKHQTDSQKQLLLGIIFLNPEKTEREISDKMKEVLRTPGAAKAACIVSAPAPKKLPIPDHCRQFPLPPAIQSQLSNAPEGTGYFYHTITQASMPMFQKLKLWNAVTKGNNYKSFQQPLESLQTYCNNRIVELFPQLKSADLSAKSRSLLSMHILLDPTTSAETLINKLVQDAANKDAQELLEKINPESTEAGLRSIPSAAL